MKKLYRNTQNKMISGVCSGIAQYFDIDPTLVRLAFAIIALVTAIVPCLIIYFICAVIIPEQTVFNGDDYKDVDNNTTYYNPPQDGENK